MIGAAGVIVLHPRTGTFINPGSMGKQLRIRYTVYSLLFVGGTLLVKKA
jgi:hypothetical protein